jgi:hypothetical protein
VLPKPLYPTFSKILLHCSDVYYFVFTFYPIFLISYHSLYSVMGIHRQQLQNTGGEFTETATQTQWYSRVHIYSYVKQDHSPQVPEHRTHVLVQDNMWAHHDLCNSYVLEGIAQVQFCTTHNLLNIWLNMYAYKWGPN